MYYNLQTKNLDDDGQTQRDTGKNCDVRRIVS